MMKVKIGYTETGRTYYVPLEAVLKELKSKLTQKEFEAAVKKILGRQ